VDDVVEVNLLHYGEPVAAPIKLKQRKVSGPRQRVSLLRLFICRGLRKRKEREKENGWEKFPAVS